MIELMKELGFIPESKVLRLIPTSDGKAKGSRYDRVTYVCEKLNIDFVSSRPVFVEARHFLQLLPFIEKAEDIDTYLKVAVNGGGIYKLPYMEAEFGGCHIEDPAVLYQGRLDLSALKKTALQNLVNPEMRCVYIDREGAVSCDYLRATVDSDLRTTRPVLIPPDISMYIDSAEEVVINTMGDNLFITVGDSFICSPAGDFLDVQEGEEPWYITIRNKATSVDYRDFITATVDRVEALKRLALFGDIVTIESQKMSVGENVEPYSTSIDRAYKFTINDILPVISVGDGLCIKDDSLYLKSGSKIVIISEVED